MKYRKKYISIPEIAPNRQEFNILKQQLENIIYEMQSENLFLRENDPVSYIEFLEYQNAIREAIENENYIDMKNLFEQWDPDNDLFSFRDYLTPRNSDF